MATYFVIAQMLIAIALIVTVLFQLRGGGIGGIFGQAESVYRTRRGLESTLLRLSIILIVLLVIFTIITATQA